MMTGGRIHSGARFATVMASLLALFGCGFVRAPFVAQPVSLLSSAYVANAGTSGTISMFEVSRSGLWTPTAPPSIAAGQLPESLVVAPFGQFVYVANARDNRISQFAIDHKTGLLAPLSPASVPAGAYPQNIAIDPSGRFVYTANTLDNAISMFTADPATGVLLPTNPATVPGGGDVSSYLGGLAIDPLARFVYANNGNTISTFSIDPVSGVLTFVAIAPSGGGRGFSPAIDPTGEFLYVPAEAQGRVVIFAINRTTGALTPAATPFVLVGDGPSSVAIDPDGKHLYVVNRNAATVSQFSIGLGGNLSPLATPLLADGGQPWQMLIDPSGQLAYVSNERTAMVEIYKFDAQGQLLPYGTAVAGTGAGGMGIAQAH